MNQISGAKNRSRVVVLIAVVAAVFAGAGFGLRHAAWPTTTDPVDTLIHRPISMLECVEDARRLVTTEKDEVSFLKQASDVCYQHIYSQGLLNDFQLRRMAFFQQRYADDVILWMVVILTFSGVVLAGLQLFASYKISSFGNISALNQTQEFEIEKGRIVLRSSVTGLFILAISFAFFYVFVVEVYKISTIDIDGGATAQQTESTETQPGYGTELQFGAGSLEVNSLSVPQLRIHGSRLQGGSLENGSPRSSHSEIGSEITDSP